MVSPMSSRWSMTCASRSKRAPSWNVPGPACLGEPESGRAHQSRAGELPRNLSRGFLHQLHNLRQVRVVYLRDGAADADGGFHLAEGIEHRSAHTTRAEAVFLVIHGVALYAHLFELCEEA